jgi:hypothetical protein
MATTRAMAVSPAVIIAAMALCSAPSLGAGLRAKTDPTAKVDAYTQVNITLRAEQCAGYIPCPVAEVQLPGLEHRFSFFDQIRVSMLGQ